MDKFELNVSYNGHHYCRIAIPETSEELAKIKCAVIRRKFGTDYEVSLTATRSVGRFIEF